MKKFFDYEIEGINTKDYPDFSDAFISSAMVNDNGDIRNADDNELDELNDNSDLVYELVLEKLL